MKVIPYLRFVCATLIVFNFFNRNSVNLETAAVVELFTLGIAGLVSFTFSSYCIIIGIQEIKEERIIDARFFEYFGLVAEALIFVTGLYIISIAFSNSDDYWAIALAVLLQIVLLIFLLVDVRRIWSR